MMRSQMAVVIAALSLGCSFDPSEEAPRPLRASILVAEGGPATADECPNGGVTLDYGIDANGNGTLDADEVSDTYAVCHGQDGATSYDQLTDKPALSAVATSGDYADLINKPTEADPVFSASEAATITSTDTGHWDTAYGWGDHSAAGYLSSESDPTFGASEAATITSTDTGHWDTAYGWGDHSAAGYLSSESDPTFGASEAATITSTDTGHWDTAYGWGDHSAAGYVSASGDTMSGALGLPSDGLTVGTDQLAVSGGNVSMSGDLTVTGTISAGCPSGMAAIGRTCIHTITPYSRGLTWFQALDTCHSDGFRLCSQEEVVNAARAGVLEQYAIADGDSWYTTASQFEVTPGQAADNTTCDVQGNTDQPGYPQYSVQCSHAKTDTGVWRTTVCCY